MCDTGLSPIFAENFIFQEKRKMQHLLFFLGNAKTNDILTKLWH